MCCEVGREVARAMYLAIDASLRAYCCSYAQLVVELQAEVRVQVPHRVHAAGVQVAEHVLRGGQHRLPPAV